MGVKFLCNQFVGNSYSDSCRCLNENILQRGVQSRWGLNSEQTDESWPFFVIEGRERRMRAGWKETESSMTLWQLRVVCWNLRKGRWDQLSKQGGFNTTGDSYVCPYYLYDLAYSPFFLPPLQRSRDFFLSDIGTIRMERGKGRGSANKQKEEESFICLENVNKKFLWQKNITNCTILCYFNQP